ncbi:MAG: hypothetical protein K8J08_16675 [Thermoanaerobaculia bacterium]|nr:hypothetical protein [Thermoanaerobaculia bacterium]
MTTSRKAGRQALLAPALLALALIVGPAVGARTTDHHQADGIEEDQRGDLGTFDEVPSPSFEPNPLGGTVRRVDLIVQEGDLLPDEDFAIGTLYYPRTNSNGVLGFVGLYEAAAGNDAFVWWNDRIVWRNSDAAGVSLTNIEPSMGLSDSGQYIYSVYVDGDDAVWSRTGLVTKAGQQAPRLPTGVLSTFHSRPSMLPNGDAYWVAGFNESGGSSTEGRVLYLKRASPPGTFVVLRSDQLIGGLPIDRPNGVGYDYAISQDGSHHIHELILRTDDPSNDAHVVVDALPVARESDPTGDGDSWATFGLEAINNQGDYLVSGTTDAPSSQDHILVYNGSVVVREGQQLGGITLNADSFVDGLALNNLGEAVVLWRSPGKELLYHSCSASNLAGAKILARTGDPLDFDGDGVEDATLTDFVANTVLGQGLALTDLGRVYVAARVAYGGPSVDAMLGFHLPGCLFSDGFESGNLGAWGDRP